MSRPSADTTWGGGERKPGPGCPFLLARVVLLAAAVLVLLSGGAP